MASYKVIQDIEAEDKLLGPLTLRQFVYAAVSVVCFYLTFLVVSKGAAFMAAVFLPIAFISGFFAWPWGQDQPTEVWALAKIRFMLKPRRRIWDQSGVKELVTVTAPKRIEVVYTNGLSQDEVQSRLKALADTIDSRGWATKNVNINLTSGQPNPALMPSDRLVNASTLPAVVEQNVDIRADDDILEESSPVARQFDSMIAASTQAHRQEILEHLKTPAAPAPQQSPAQSASGTGQPQNNYWFLNQPSASTQVPQDAVTFNTQVVTPHASAAQVPSVPGAPQAQVTAADEQALINRLHQQEALENSVNPFSHYHTVQPLSAQNNIQAGGPTQPSQTQITAQMAQINGQLPPTDTTMGPQPAPQGPAPVVANNPTNAQQQVTAAPDPAILQLASNDDLDVATIAREANKRKELQDEVVISLH